LYRKGKRRVEGNEKAKRKSSMLKMDLVNLKVLALIPCIFFWPFEKLRGLG